jgi:hypothetical protein
MVGNESTVITTVSGEFGQVPKAVVHTKVFMPFVNPVTVELLIVFVVMAPPPLTILHVPKPIVGVLPLNTAVDVQMV